MRFSATTAAIALLAFGASTACVGPTLDDTTPIEGSISGGAASTGSRRGGGSSAGGASGQGSPSGNGAGGSSGSAAGNSSGGNVGSTGGGASSGAAASSAGAASSGSGGPSSGGASTGVVSGGGPTSGGLGNGSSGGSTGVFTGSSSGGSTGAGASSGGSSGGSGCNPLGTGLADLSQCTATSQCDCPDVCNNDPAFGAEFCEPTCATTTDCSDPRTVCRGGVCVFNLCGPSGGGGSGGPGANGVASGACSAAGVNDGTCWPSYTPADPTTTPPTPAFALWLCYQGGTDPDNGSCIFLRGAAGSMCTPGDLCLSPDGGPAGYCNALCDPTAQSATCPSGQGCGAEDLSDDAAPAWGVCFPEVGGCLEDYTDNELSPCSENSGCGCVTPNPLSCVNDSSLAINLYNSTTYCERTCTKTTDCPIAYTSCNAQKECSLNECGNAGSGVGISARCNAAATQDGTCVPSYNSNGSVAYGLCYQGGPVAVDGTCDPDATRTFDENELCVAGAYCFNTPSAGNLCIQICNPDAGAGACPGATCNVADVTQTGEPAPVDFGICQP